MLMSVTLQMNYSDLARRHGLQDQKVGNMIVKEYLIEQGVDLQRFQQFRKRPAKARRKLNRTYGGENTVPTPRTTREIKETLKVCHVAYFLYVCYKTKE